MAGSRIALSQIRGYARAQAPTLEITMDFIAIEVDGDLARQYMDRYRELFQVRRVARLSDKDFLRAFVEDRLREEFEFLGEEAE